MTNFKIIRERTDKSIDLLNQLATSITDIELNPSDIEVEVYTNIKISIMYLMYYTGEIKEANQERNLMLSEGSINKLYDWSGILTLIMEKLRHIMYINKKASSMSIKDVEGQMLSMVEELIEILFDNENIFNELGFFKDLYNRQLDEHLIKSDKPNM